MALDRERRTNHKTNRRNPDVTHTLTVAALLAATLTTTPAAAHAATPRQQLAALTVHTEDTGAHYNRADWGAWTTVTGCSTRERVLRRDADPGTVLVGLRCTVTAGRWVSLYDDVTVTADQPRLIARELQIDHVVPLAEAQRSGARGWTRAQRVAYYNDVRNLRAVTAHSNTSKGDSDPPRWAPPARGSWCWYATAWIRVKTAYRLTVDAAERARLRAMLDTCGGGR